MPFDSIPERPRMLTTSEILEAAAAIVKQGWCQCTAAKDIHGDGVDPTSRHAVAWCASGAIQRAAGVYFGYGDRGLEHELAEEALEAFNDFLHSQKNVPEEYQAFQWNDHQYRRFGIGRRRVAKALRQAAALERAKEMVCATA